MWKALFCYLLLLHFTLSAKGQVINIWDETEENINDSESVRENWKKLEKTFRSVINGGIKMLLPGLMQSAELANISSTCISDAMQVLTGIRRLETWAMRLPDSSAKGLEGALSGTIFNYGNYEECVDTVAVNQRSGKRKGEVMFTGKYCLLIIKFSLPPKKPFYKPDEVIDELKSFKNGTVFAEAAKYVPYYYFAPIRLGLCIPSGCSESDVNRLLANVARQIGIYMKVSKCEVKEETKFTSMMIFVMSIYSLVGFVVLLATAVDIYSLYSGRKMYSMSIRMLQSFSFLSNFRKLTDTSTSSKSLSCLNGIRFLTMSWVISGHSYVVGILFLAGGTYYARSQMQEFAVQVLANAYLSVDTFFFIGGFLVCYLSTKSVLIEKKKFSIAAYIFHRLWRILPVYIFIILYMFIWETTYSGPAAHHITKMFVDRCKQNWWTNLLFINNFLNGPDMCLPYTWYLAVDLQLYLVSLIILLPLFRWPKAGMGIAVVSLVVSVVASAVITYVKNFPPTLLLTSPNIDLMATVTSQFYVKPHTHACSYVTGIISGYILAMNPNLKIPKVVQVIGWSLAIIFSMSSLYGTYDWYRLKEKTIWETTIFAGFHRFAWVSSIAWMVLCCATGHGGIVNYILSWKVWILLGRLTFTAYLVHPIVQLSVISSIRGPIPPLHSVAAWLNFGNLVVTYGVAFVVSILIESPFMSLEKLIMPQQKKKKEENPKKTDKDAIQVLDDVKMAKDRDSDILNTKWNGFQIYKLQQTGTEKAGLSCEIVK